MKNNNKGITLIALVVTIIVLIILASISIATLTGDNGIINQSKEAKEETEIAEERETAEISAVQAAGMDRYGNVTEENLRNQLNKNIGNGKYELEVVGEKFKVTYTESQRSYYVDKDGNIEIADGSNSDDGIYSESVSEDEIAPEDLFNYEIINDGRTAKIGDIMLPEKTVKITGIKAKYCNEDGYNPDTGSADLPDTNYEIIYEGQKISDTLVIPYKVDGKFVQGGIEGEEYTIAEVDLTVYSSDKRGDYMSMPHVETIIYPNTVEKIYSTPNSFGGKTNSKLKKVILPENITEIPNYMFKYCSNIQEIEIPENVTSIGEDAFFMCSSLKNIIIPNKVVSIGDSAFRDCTNLKTITIPESVVKIEEYAFYYCDSLTTINYTGTQEQWNKIEINNSGNSVLENIDINFMK